jgi:lipopolysaccharide transport system ATP-binding protein
VAAFGHTSTVVGQYLSRDYLRPAPGARIDVSTLPRTGTGDARFVSVAYTAGGEVDDGSPYPDGPLEFVLEIESAVPRDVRSLSVFLLEQYGAKILNADTLHLDRTVSLREGLNTVRLRIASIHLLPGTYRVGLWLADPVHAQSVTGAYDYVESAFEIEVVTRGAGAPAGIGGIVTCDFTVEEVP